MPADPKLVLDEDVLRFVLSLTGARRKRLLAQLEHLRCNHHDAADFREKVGSGRWLSLKVLHPFLITYWLDGAVDELRIVDVELVRG
jgi:hypothetical protein